MTNDDLPDIPQPLTEPAVATERRNPGPKPKSKPQPKTGRGAGADLVPDLEEAGSSTETRLFWLGAMPGCPTEQLDLAGIHFPKIQEMVDRTDASGPPSRIPVVGSVVALTRTQIDTMRERLRRTVIRFRADTSIDPMLEDPEGKRKPAPVLTGNGQGIAVTERRSHRPRKGHAVTIPTQDVIEAAAKSGAYMPAYSRQQHDEPAARYLFCVPCEDQVIGSRGTTYPPSLEDTGLEWPLDE